MKRTMVIELQRLAGIKVTLNLILILMNMTEFRPINEWASKHKHYYSDEQDDIKLRFDFEITPNAECANIYKAIGATITGSHICTRSIDQSASVDMCRGNYVNQIKYCRVRSR